MHNRSTSSSSLNVQPAAITKSMTTMTGKVYNKNDLRKRKIKSTGFDQLTTTDDWKCPNISENSRYLECGCDIPYTLRCSGDIHGLQQIAHGLRQSKYPVSLLDCTLKNVTFLSDARIFDNVSLHGLVISSGEIKRVHRHAFLGLKMPLQALGLPNNALMNVPAHSLTSLTSLDRLDLSNNRIKYLGPSDFLVSVCPNVNANANANANVNVTSMLIHSIDFEHELIASNRFLFWSSLMFLFFADAAKSYLFRTKR